MQIGLRTHLSALCAAVAVFFVVAAAPGYGATLAPRYSDQGTVPADAAAAGRVDPAEPVSFDLTLPLRNESELDNLIARLYTPGDPMYHHFLTTSEFSARYAPSADDYNNLAAAAKAAGLTVTQTTSNRLLLGVSGPSSTVESLFAVHMLKYNVEGRDAHAPDSAATIPDSMLPLGADVVGLNTAPIWHPHVLRPNAAVTGHLGSGVQGSGLAPSDIRAIYGMANTRDNGAGQIMGLVELDAYVPSDITTYTRTYGLPNPNLVVVPVDGGVSSPGSGSIEDVLDIEVTLAMAPNLGTLRVYEAPNGTLQNAVDVYNQIALENICKTVSTSWGLDEVSAGKSIRNSENSDFKEMAAQGQSMFAAAGDNGAYDNGRSLSVDDPASQPYVTGAGGTTLTASANNVYTSETTWDDPTPVQGAPHGSGGGGGLSVDWSIPTFQSGITFNGSSGQYSTSFRNVPDVCLNADPNTGYSLYYTDPQEGPSWITVGGTSACAPSWAAFTALVNQQLAESAAPPVGFENALLYTIYGNATQYARDFHDIADGSNNLHYIAVRGYDTATGLGSMIGNDLIADLSHVAGGPPSYPSVTSLSPAAASPGSLALTVTIDGANFLPNSLAYWNTTQLSTTYVSGTQLTTVIPALLLATVGVGTLTVGNPDGTVSAGSSFTVNSTLTTPTISLLSPSATAVGGLTFTLTVTGSGFASGATVDWNGSPLSTTFVTSGELTASTPAALIAAAGLATITVVNPNSSVSNSATLTIAANAPTIGSLSPPSAGAGSASFTLTVTGSTFLPSSVIEWNGSQLSTTYVSSTELTATVSATLVQTATTADVSVANLPVGGTSNTVLFTVTQTVPAPTITSTTPASLPVGGAAQTLKIFGAGYISSTTVVLGGVALQSTLIDSGEIDATVPASLLTSAANLTLVVTTPSPGGGQAQLQVSVVNPAPSIGSLNPASASAKGAAFTITIIGANFVPGSIINFGTATLATTYVSSTELQGMVPASAIATVGNASVSVYNPPPSGGSSAMAAFSIQPAVLFTFSAGLQMISAPNDYSFIPLGEALSSTDTVLASWNPLGDTYEITPTAPSNALNPGMGYWVRFTGSVNLYDVGAAITTAQDYPIALSPGWNMIGTPYTQSTPISSLLIVTPSGDTMPFATAAGDGLVSGTLFSYDTASSQYDAHTTDSIEAYSGYWIFAQDAVTLEIPSPTAQPL